MADELKMAKGSERAEVYAESALDNDSPVVREAEGEGLKGGEGMEEGWRSNE